MRTMIVCVCHNVNEKRIAECAADGVRSVKQLCATTRAGTRCGKCLCEARDVLRAAVAEVQTAKTVNALVAA